MRGEGRGKGGWKAYGSEDVADAGGADDQEGGALEGGHDAEDEEGGEVGCQRGADGEGSEEGCAAERGL